MADNLNEKTDIEKRAHHERKELCTTRPKYRQGRKLTAVKVFTVNDESRHILIHGVPAISVVSELKTLCEKHGSIEEIRLVKDYPTEKFCEVYYVRFHLLPSARHAKIHLDDRSFFGGILHVCYAPEMESIEDTRSKLMKRKQEVLQRLNPIRSHPTSYTQEYATENTSLIASELTSEPVQLQERALTEVISATPVRPTQSQNNVVQLQRPTPVKRIVLHNRSSEGTEIPLFKRPKTTDQ